jgi:hypothetical protein
MSEIIPEKLAKNQTSPGKSYSFLQRSTGSVSPEGGCNRKFLYFLNSANTIRTVSEGLLYLSKYSRILISKEVMNWLKSDLLEWEHINDLSTG